MSRSDSTDTGPDTIRNGDTVDHASGVILVTLVIPIHVTRTQESNLNTWQALGTKNGGPNRF